MKYVTFTLLALSVFSSSAFARNRHCHPRWPECMEWNVTEVMGPDTPDNESPVQFTGLMSGGGFSGEGCWTSRGVTHCCQFEDGEKKYCY